MMYYWENINVKPTIEGLYVVARFEGDKMIEFSTNYIYLKEMGSTLFPNTPGTGLEKEPTHYMTYKDYRMMLEALPKKTLENGIWTVNL